MHAKSLQLCQTLCNPIDCRFQVPLSVGFSRKGYWRGCWCPPPGDLSDPIETASHAFVSCSFIEFIIYSNILCSL